MPCEPCPGSAGCEPMRDATRTGRAPDGHHAHDDGLYHDTPSRAEVRQAIKFNVFKGIEAMTDAVMSLNREANHRDG
jgi:hypothetical protein